MNTEIRTTLNLPADLAEAVDDFWHSARLNSRNEAIRVLLTKALDEIREPPRVVTADMAARIRVAQTTKGKRP